MKPLNLLICTLGAASAAFGLEEFLIPNNIIDGGVIGVSILLGHLTHWPIGLFIVLLNLPFLYIAYQRAGKAFVWLSLFAISALALFTHYAHPFPPVTRDLLLVAVFGGIFVGIGVGLIIRAHGSTDGTEIIAMLLSSRYCLSVGEIILFINVFIFILAGFVFGWERAMYSLITYFVASKMIDLVIEGFDESKSVVIISPYAHKIGRAIITESGRGITYLTGQGGYTGTAKRVIYCVITRLELPRIKEIVLRFDPCAFIAVENVHEVTGGRFRRRTPLESNGDFCEKCKE
ncbi:MAG TPA: hypothetical protein DEA44_06805 [Firmicutes bacterium]|mgnify:CR=1 FL=1|nr:hypothetical protein [Bacillota bacterium]HWR55283.1 YitT family protein [Negativicutes bacterium]